MENITLTETPPPTPTEQGRCGGRQERRSSPSRADALKPHPKTKKTPNHILKSH